MDWQYHTFMCEKKFSLQWLYHALTPEAVLLWNTSPVTNYSFTSLQDF